MNLFQAVNNAVDIALTSDPTAGESCGDFHAAVTPVA